MGLVVHAEGRDLHLSTAGRAAADAIFRRHALLEWLLTSVVGLGWAESDDEAMRLQGAISPRVEARLDEMLGHPETCPHGNPIDAETARRRPAGIRLSEIEAGLRATIYRITEEAEEDAGLLSYLEARALTPGAHVTILARSESLDSLTLDGPRGRATLGPAARGLDPRPSGRGGPGSLPRPSRGHQQQRRSAMIEFVRSRHIDAPAERIWPFVFDIGAWPKWFTEAERGEVLSGEGVGRRQRMYGHARGKATEIDSIVTASEPPSRLRWHHEAERVDGKPGSVVFARDASAEVTIQPDGAGSLVTYRLLAEPGSLLNTFMLRVMAPRPIGRSFETSLARLAALVEGPAAPA